MDSEMVIAKKHTCVGGNVLSSSTVMTIQRYCRNLFVNAVLMHKGTRLGKNGMESLGGKTDWKVTSLVSRLTQKAI